MELLEESEHDDVMDAVSSSSHFSGNLMGMLKQRRESRWRMKAGGASNVDLLTGSRLMTAARALLEHGSGNPRLEITNSMVAVCVLVIGLMVPIDEKFVCWLYILSLCRTDDCHSAIVVADCFKERKDDETNAVEH